MKLQHLTASAFVLLGLVSLGCSSPDDEIFMGSDGSGGSGGTKDPGGAGTGQGASESGGTGSGGSSNGAGTGMGGSSSAGTNSAGTGMGGTASGGTGSGGYEPCAGKACGDFCSPCDPKDANCVAPAVEFTCTSTGACSIGRPACTVPECEAPQQYFAPGCASAAKPAPPADPIPPFVPGCYDLCSSAGTCAEGFTCTEVWTDPSANCPPGEACIAACGGVAKICIGK